MKITEIETVWASDQVREFVEHLQREVARAFAFPEAIQRNPEALARALHDAWHATVLIRCEIASLTSRFSFPRFYVTGDGLTVAQRSTKPEK